MLSYTTPAVTVEEANSYAALRGWSSWSTGSTADKESALRRSQDVIASFNDRWSSSWTEAPEGVKFAIIEGARRELDSPNSLTPDVIVGRIVKRQKVEGIEREFAVNEKSGSGSMKPTVEAITRYLRPYLSQSFGASVEVWRV